MTATPDAAAPPPAQRVAINTVLRAAAEILGKVATLVLTVVMIHKLGDEPFADFAFALAVTQLYWPIAGFGLDRLLLREIAIDPSKADGLIPQLNAFKLVVGAICTVVGALLVASLDRGSDVTWTTVILGVTLVATLFGATAQSVFMAHERTQDYFVAALPVKVAGSILGIFVLVAGGGIIAVATTSLIAALFGIGIGWALLIRKYHVRGMKLGGTPRTWGALARRSGPWGVQEIFGQVIFRAGIIVLYLFAGKSATTDYRLAYQLMEASLFVPWSVGTSVLPLIARAKSIGKNGADAPADPLAEPVPEPRPDDPPLPAITRAGIELVLALMLPVAVLMVICAHPLLTTIFASDGAAAAALLPYLGLASIAYAVGHIAGLVALAHLPGRRTIEITAIAALFSVVLLLLLVPSREAEGAAIAALATETLLAALTVGLAARAAGWGIVKSLVSIPLLGAFVMAIVVTPVRDDLLLSIVLGSLAYVLVVGLLEYRRKGAAWTVVRSLLPGTR